MTAPCGCCEGVERVTPIAIANRPGLPALAYRVGTHAAFFETMLARLQSMPVDVEESDALGKPNVLGRYPLSRLTARTPDDAAIALLDAWAIVADVLTFYQERIANEGYLRTATERRSILELARLVGYRLRPGVASSVYLAYTLEPGREVEIPAGSRAQSLPGPGELPQSFETSEPLHARAEWNNLQVRLTRPQRIVLSEDSKSIDKQVIYFAGTGTNLRPGDPLLFLFSQPANGWIVRHVKKVEPKPAADRTRVELQEAAASGSSQNGPEEAPSRVHLNGLIEQLTVRPARPPTSSIRLTRDLQTAAGPHRDLLPQLLTTLRPDLQGTLHRVWESASVTDSSTVQVYAFRVKASLFGYNAGKQPACEGNKLLPTEYWHEWPADGEQERVIYLDNAYDQIVSGSHIVIQQPGSDPRAFTGVTADPISRAAYGITAKTTRLTLREGEDWPAPNMKTVRETSVYAQSEELTLAEEPLTDCVGTHSDRPD